MILLLTFIIVWALSPGPVAVMTFHESRKYGVRGGVAVSVGATITSAFMVIIALLLLAADAATLLESNMATIIEHAGGLGIIVFGLHAGYKSLYTAGQPEVKQKMASPSRRGIVQGMMIMATYIPQALVFYTIIVPQSVSAESVWMTTLLLGTLKVVLILGWHVGIAVVTTRVRGWMPGQRVGRFLEMATACLLVGLGINILI